jgi:hypothetical protein
MFAIHSPQTITLNVPGEDRPDALMNFKVKEGDTSRCVLQIIFPDGEMHELTFNVRGSLLSSNYIVPTDENDADRTAEPNATAHIVDGRDMRAFDPYKYQPPVADADAAYRDGQNPGFTQPPVQNEDQRQMAEQAKADAAERAKEEIQKLKDLANESAEDRAAREKEERDAAYDKALEQASQPADATGSATAETFPSQKTQDLVEGKTMTGEPISNPDNDPMAPAPSSPQPGSPPPHPLGQSDPGRVTTSKDLSGEPLGTSAEKSSVNVLEEKREADAAQKAADQKEAEAEKPAYDTESAARDNSKTPA